MIDMDGIHLRYVLIDLKVNVCSYEPPTICFHVRVDQLVDPTTPNIRSSVSKKDGGLADVDVAEKSAELV